MTLEEAIIYCKEMAKNCQLRAYDIERDDYKDLEECAADHRQLAEWLKLLKRILDSGDCNDCAMLHRQCRYALGLGEHVRYNCPFYSQESEESE